MVRLQLALDFVDFDRALRVAEAVAPFVDVIEAGTPLIKSEGLGAVRLLRKRFPGHQILADMKVLDAGRIEVESAAKAGAHLVGVAGAASDATVRECVEAAKNVGCLVVADLIAVGNPVKRAGELEALGVVGVAVHLAIDQHMQAKNPLSTLRLVRKTVKIHVYVAGGITPKSAALAAKAGADVVVVGGYITKAENPGKAAKAVKAAIKTGKAPAEKLFERTIDVKKLLKKVSSANLSDAIHRKGALSHKIKPLKEGCRAVGPAYTVKTVPGDWAKPVEAIDSAPKGSVIVVDALGRPPAVWGELATRSALLRGVSGVVVFGAVRDVGDIRMLGLPVFASHMSPHAGEPKGLGEINVPVSIGGVEVSPGDWVLADDDGVVVLPSGRAVEYANRAVDVLERENRIRAEIKSTRKGLSEVTHLLKWEKAK
ncbi:Bifunctional enzyme Fae/Hps [uncultured archaeon]|nr:Bifunctional enzyme Fae/Hps [uncultured archaeon]